MMTGRSHDQTNKIIFLSPIFEVKNLLSSEAQLFGRVYLGGDAGT